MEKEPKKVNVREALKDHYESLAQDLPPDIVEKEIKKDERLLELVEERTNRNISEVATKFDREQFDKDLRDVYPNWREIWPTPEFQAFLAEVDGISGFERYDVINGAFQRFDSKTVIRAFNVFFGRSGTSSSQASSSSRTMSVAEARRQLKQLGEEKSRGFWNGREAEYRKKEAALWKAIDG